MAIVRRANVILEVKDYEIQRYKDDGYDVIDETGKVIEATIPTDKHTLQKAYKEQLEEIAKLKARIEELEAKSAVKAVDKKEVETTTENAVKSSRKKKIVE